MNILCCSYDVRNVFFIDCIVGHEIHVHTKETNLAYHFGHACRSVIHAEFIHHKIFADFSTIYLTRPENTVVVIFNLDMHVISHGLWVYISQAQIHTAARESLTGLRNRWFGFDSRRLEVFVTLSRQVLESTLALIWQQSSHSLKLIIHLHVVLS